MIVSMEFMWNALIIRITFLISWEAIVADGRADAREMRKRVLVPFKTTTTKHYESLLLRIVIIQSHCQLSTFRYY